jgi:hypothetical protein
VSVLGVMIAAAVSGAACGGDDGVLPPEAKPLGYSLKDAVAAVAAFDVGPRTPATVPDVPFQVLYVLNGPPYPTEATFTVKPGTYLYVPLFFADDSPPIIGDFPDDVRDRWADAEYIFDPDEFGGSFEINVDGKSMWVGPEYVAGAETAALPDGGGTHAIGVAVFLKPLSKGKHKITLNLALEGDAWIAAAGGPAEEVLTYEVIVK